MSLWHFDLFSEEKPVLFAWAPPIVCTRPCVSANPTRLDTITIQGLCFCTFIGSHSHHLAPCFSTLQRERGSRSWSWFSCNRISDAPTHPDIQKEMSLQLAEEEDISRSSFYSGETPHDKEAAGQTRHFHFQFSAAELQRCVASSTSHFLWWL